MPERCTAAGWCLVSGSDRELLFWLQVSASVLLNGNLFSVNVDAGDVEEERLCWLSSRPDVAQFNGRWGLALCLVSRLSKVVAAQVVICESDQAVLSD